MTIIESNEHLVIQAKYGFVNSSGSVVTREGGREGGEGGREGGREGEGEEEERIMGGKGDKKRD